MSAPELSRRRVETPAWFAARTREQQATTPYFGLGFDKTRMPPDLFDLVQGRIRGAVERFEPAASREEVRSLRPSMVPALRLRDPTFDEEVCGALHTEHEARTGMKLERAAGSGLFVYQRGTYVLPHVNRMGAGIFSSVACIAGELDEPWPVYLEDVDGKAHEIELAPGDLLFYEGARLIHGHPWPLRGRFLISLAVHFRPAGLGIGVAGEAEAKGEEGHGAAKDTPAATEAAPPAQRKRQERGVHPLTNVDEGHLGGYLRSSSALPGFTHGDPQTWEPEVWKWAVETFSAKSLLDVGCGEAHSTKFFRDLGCRVLGVDGSLQAKEASAVPDRHIRHDFVDGPFIPDEGFDLVWSCEFVEHVEERFVDHFLATFGVARKALMMTFAGTGQPGWHHVNCQGADYWIEKVEGLGLRFDRELTSLARTLAGAQHFAHRGLVFVRRSSTPRIG
ncbi:MAG: class I SAM-dependent methyltransferase [Acidobacteriota bacterium]